MKNTTAQSSSRREDQDKAARRVERLKASIQTAASSVSELNAVLYSRSQANSRSKSASQIKDDVLDALAADEGKPASESSVLATIKLAGVSASLLSNGEVVRDTVLRVTEVEVVDGVKTNIVREVALPYTYFADVGSSPLVGSVGPMPMRAGLTAIVGKGGIGKTPIAHALAGSATDYYGFVRFGEPFAGYMSDPEQLVHSVLAGMVRYNCLIIDSVKDVLSMSNGAAMKSGLSRSILPELSSVAIAAANLGCNVIIPINPSSDDAEVMSLLVEALRSNVTTVLSSQGPNTWQFSARAGEGKNRDEGVLNIGWRDGVPFIGAAGGLSFRNNDASVVADVQQAEATASRLINKAQ